MTFEIEIRPYLDLERPLEPGGEEAPEGSYHAAEYREGERVQHEGVERNGGRNPELEQTDAFQFYWRRRQLTTPNTPDSQEGRL
jgi:hypothetical protein